MTDKKTLNMHELSIDERIALDYFVASRNIFENISLYSLLNWPIEESKNPAYVLSEEKTTNYSIESLKPTQQNIVRNSLDRLYNDPYLKINIGREELEKDNTEQLEKIMKYHGQQIDLRKLPVVVLNNRDYSPKGLYLLVGHIRSRYALDNGQQSIEAFSLDCFSDDILLKLSRNFNSISQSYGAGQMVNVKDLKLI